jgi:hypothetical protein
MFFLFASKTRNFFLQKAAEKHFDPAPKKISSFAIARPILTNETPFCPE